MSLHDRIMGMTAPDNVAQHPLCMGGFSVAQQEAAQLAKEADKLINWCQAHIETLRQIADSAASFDEAKIALDRIKKFKEQTK